MRFNMSESENIYATKNLCVPEDAFEQFQAVAAYEEEEFITLSDIVEPQQPTLDINACLEEIQDDICIVNESDPQLRENTDMESIGGTCQELLNPVKSVSVKNIEEPIMARGKTIQNVRNKPSSSIQQCTPKKRGRRKKATELSVIEKHKFTNECIKSDHNYQSILSEEGVTDSEDTVRLKESVPTRLDASSSQKGRRKRKFQSPAISQAIISTTEDTHRPRKRGRPRKVDTLTVNLNRSNADQYNLRQQDKSYKNENDNSVHVKSSDQSNRVITNIENNPESEKLNSSLNDSNDAFNLPRALDSTTEKNSKKKKTCGKRGRPKKNCQVTNNLKSDSPVVISNEISSVGITKPETEGLKSKTNEKKYDEVELELLRLLSTPTKELEEKTNVEETKTKEKHPKKRGRKQKKSNNKQDTSFNIDQNIEKPQAGDEMKQVLDMEQSDDEIDDICLRSLKEQLKPEDEYEEATLKNAIVEEQINHNTTETSDNTMEVSTKRISKKSIMSDFEYNVDTIVNETIVENVDTNMEEVNNPEIESPSKRPIRRNVKKILHYDEGSDEDPFANVELSDDDDLSGRRGGKYYSDDEYVPGKRKKGKAYSESESSTTSECDVLVNNEALVSLKGGKKKGKKTDESRKKNSKRSKKGDMKQSAVPDVTSTAADTTTQNDDDFDSSLQSSDVTTNDNLNTKPSQAWSMSHEFENFIAQKIQGTNIKIKKLSAATSNESAITPLKIPVLDPNEPKKTVEIFTQTSKISTKSIEIQTTSPYETIMKKKVPLTADQSEKACEFLKGIVRNTSELGQLMIQKSEDFIQKKINTKNITDTSKLDYCVQKSFLLFKLAKHNLIQMDEDLANEYQQFLKSNNLLQHFEMPKHITPTTKLVSSDSDCEIVDEPIKKQEKEKEKSKFNPKTVFLNKELSIKIAKKSTEEPQRNKEKVNLKGGSHTVWINDSIMVKKVKPNQSFLAQDSRNKKPPDSKITIEMVKDFFDNYNKHQQVVLKCAPFVSSEWLNVKQVSICNYFIVQSPHSGLSTHPVISHIPPTSESNNNVLNHDAKRNNIAQPMLLQALCTKALQKYMYEKETNTNDCMYLPFKQEYQPKSLFKLSIDIILGLLQNDVGEILNRINVSQTISSLKLLSLRSINSIIHKPFVFSKLPHPEVPIHIMENFSISQYDMNSDVSNPMNHSNTIKPSEKNIKTLFSICLAAIQRSDLCIQQRVTKKNNVIINGTKTLKTIDFQNTIKPSEKNIKTLFSMCLTEIQQNKLCIQQSVIKKKNVINGTKTLKLIAFDNVKQLMYNDHLYGEFTEKTTGEFTESLRQFLPFEQNCLKNKYCRGKTDKSLGLTIESVNTLSDDIFAKLPDAVSDESPCLEDEGSSFSNYDEYEPDYAEPNPEDDTSEESNWVSQLEFQELKSVFMPVDNKTKTPVIKELNMEYVMASIKIEPIEEMSDHIDQSTIKTEPEENDDDINFSTITTKLETPDSVAPEDVVPEQNSSSHDVDAYEVFARTNKMLHTDADCDLADEIFSQRVSRVRKQHEPDVDNDFDTNMSLLVPQSIESAKDRLMESSSDGEHNPQKNVTKKKRKIRSKITRQKNRDVLTNKEKNPPDNEVALLTKKMQEKIRQKEKTDDSSDSELENSLALRRENAKKEYEIAKAKRDTEIDNQIQCNDVDSTENINDKTVVNSDFKKTVTQKKNHKLRKRNKGNNLLDIDNSTEHESSCVIQPDAPVELLECEPTLPMMHDEMENIETVNGDVDENNYNAEYQNIQEPASQEELQYTNRHGWKCYPVNNNDTKLYEYTYISLEKLPESFVETYFRYQGMADKNQDDNDIDRLTNLQSLHRTSSKENKTRTKTRKLLPNGQLKSKASENDSRTNSTADDDQCDELTPSEDEGANIDDEITPELSQQETENVMAKNSLMNDVDSDSEKHPEIVNPEVEERKLKTYAEKKEVEPTIKSSRPGPKSKKGIKENDSLTLLTADKMMNKELTLLHAPVKLKAEEVEVKVEVDVSKKPSPRITRKSSRLRNQLEQVKQEEESSSEEEKQWVNTKEKLLKRLGRKQENSSVDDAKRAKLVSEFIEKRGDAPDKRPICRTRKRRSRRKFLERQKQMSVLNNELFGDTSYTGKRRSQAFGKGRKNIRKVIDKKSLARGTLVANMEEFARKRRLCMQQQRLREELGCEEGVNVLVINDEVCLEYDFEQMQPVVTIHPFFTKVMKAHQYEGVKFMWDACFESLALVASGHPGGGCILAHCMGLGKTLQVLALLHTVLTHPGVGMKRVLVCCPLSTVLNWVDEINKWIGPVTNQIKQRNLRRKLQVFELSKLKKTYERAYQLEDWYKDGGIFIIGYELFRSLTTLDPELDDIRPKIVDKIRHALLNPGPDMVICDEGHLLKNDASVLAVAMSRVATKRRIVLTGTPMQNNLREYYCMVNFVKPSLLGTYAEYSNRFENPIMNGQHRDSQEEDIKLMKARTHILHKVLEGCLQRQEASVLYPYLPKKHEYTVFIPPTKCQWDLYKHYIMKYALEQQQNQKQQNKPQKQSLLKDFHVLQKIWTHPHVLHNFLMKARDERNKIKEEKLEDDLAQEDLAASEDVKPNQTEVWWLQYLEGGDMLESLESSNKFVVVFQLLEEFITLGDKVLIFSTSLYTMDALEYFLKRINKWSLGQEYFRLDGSVPAEVRQNWCREFNAPHNINTKLFLISTRAGCLGLNMTAANRVIILDTSWNPAHDIQSIFRVYRFGQKKDCFIYRLVSMGTMEQKIYERSVTKQAVSCRVVDEQQIDRHYNMAELTELYRYDEEGASVEAGLAAGVSDVALLRVAARARLHAVREHDSLLRGSREQHLPEHERNAAWMQFQQEHANNEMQDRLLEASQGIQRLLDADLAQPSGSIPVILEEQHHPTVPQTGPKSKKCKKKAATNSTPQVEEPNTVDQKDTQWDSVKEEAKVKKIMQLLIKHNFHTSKHAHEITELVSNVRSIVDAGGGGLEYCDELTRSIATVMLQEEEHMIVPTLEPPPITDIMTGDLSEQSQGEVKLQMAHKISDDIAGEVTHEILDTSDDTPDEMIDDKTLFTTPRQRSLVVPVIDTARKLRERPVKRTRGQRRKVNSNDESNDEINDETYTPLEFEANTGVTEYMEKRSKRTRRRPCKSSELDKSVFDHYSSKETSPEIIDEPVEVPAKKRVRIASNASITAEQQMSLLDDEDTTSNGWEPFPGIIEEPQEPEIKKPRRAIAVKSTAKVTIPETNLNGKTTRKAALAAKKSLERLDNADIVTLDDDDEEWFDDSEKKYCRNSSTNKSGTPPQTPDTTKKYKSKTMQDVEMKSTSKASSRKERERRESIVMSDDDCSPSNQGSSNPIVTRSDVPSAKSRDTMPEETVPLHPSMLSNANFIKIVAYAYQSNRMLDEDAALLAARYSTQKALKEYESSGKCITSGPLYDIAVKVLGIDVLKKLHDKKGLKKNDRTIKHVSVESTSSKQDTLPQDKVKKAKVRHKGNLKDDDEPISSRYKSQQNVVPIGMFKGSVSMSRKAQVVEECILPDDDDEDSILGSTNETLSVTENLYAKPKSQQLIITAVKATAGGRSESQLFTPIETIVPEVEPLTISVSQCNNVPTTVPKVEPFVTITERSKYIIPNTSSYRVTKDNVVTEPAVVEVEEANMISVPQPPPYLTLTISEGKLVQSQSQYGESNFTNKVHLSAAGSSSNTICLDSDEEEMPIVNTITKTVNVPSHLTKSANTTHSSAPTPVAVATSTPNLLNKNIAQGSAAIRLNKKDISVIAPEAQSKKQTKNVVVIPPSNSQDKSKQNKDTKSSITSNKVSAPVPKFPKILPKSNDGLQSVASNLFSKTIVRPEDVINGMAKDKPMIKKCKPGDIVRITKQGNLEVLSRVNKLPNNLLTQMLNTASKPPEAKGTESKSLETIANKRKNPTVAATTRALSPDVDDDDDDPLSIFKDVIHIQADDYDDDTVKSQSTPGTTIKPNAQTEVKKLNLSSKSDNSPKIFEINKTFTEPRVQAKKKDVVLQLSKKELTDIKKLSKPGGVSKPASAGTIDLTNVLVDNKPVAVLNKPAEKLKAKNSVVVGSSKDIIIFKKQSGSTLLKASTSATPNQKNVKREATSNATDNKKRTSPWPAPNSAKKKNVVLSKPAQTLEDFDIEDIDDIIELE